MLRLTTASNHTDIQSAMSRLIVPSMQESYGNCAKCCYFSNHKKVKPAVKSAVLHWIDLSHLRMLIGFLLQSKIGYSLTGTCLHIILGPGSDQDEEKNICRPPLPSNILSTVKFLTVIVFNLFFQLSVLDHLKCFTLRPHFHFLVNMNSSLN